MLISLLSTFISIVSCGNTLTAPFTNRYETLIEHAVYYGMPKHFVDLNTKKSFSDMPETVKILTNVLNYYTSKARGEIPPSELQAALDFYVAKQNNMQMFFGFEGWSSDLKAKIASEKGNSVQFSIQDHIIFYFLFFKEEYKKIDSSNFSNNLIFLIIFKLFKDLKGEKIDPDSAFDVVIKSAFELCIDEIREIRTGRPSYLENLRDKALYSSKFVSHHILLKRQDDEKFAFTVKDDKNKNLSSAGTSLYDKTNIRGIGPFGKFSSFLENDPWSSNPNNVYYSADEALFDVSYKISGRYLIKKIKMFLGEKAGLADDAVDYQASDDSSLEDQEVYKKLNSIKTVKPLNFYENISILNSKSGDLVEKGNAVVKNPYISATNEPLCLEHDDSLEREEDGNKQNLEKVPSDTLGKSETNQSSLPLHFDSSLLSNFRNRKSGTLRRSESLDLSKKAQDSFKSLNFELFKPLDSRPKNFAKKLKRCATSFEKGSRCNRMLQNQFIIFMNDYRMEHQEILKDWKLVLSKDNNYDNYQKKVFIEALNLRYLVLLNFKNFMALVCNYCNILNKVPDLFSYEINFEKCENSDGEETGIDLLIFRPTNFKQLLINQLASMYALASMLFK